MIKHVWSVLCQKSVVDSTTNNISLIEVFEQLEVDIKPQSPDIPAPSGDVKINFPYELVNFWTKDKNLKSEAEVKITLLDPKGRIIKSLNKHILIPKKNRRLREVNKISDLLLRSSGIYTFKVSIGDGKSKFKTVAEIPLEIKIKKGKN